MIKASAAFLQLPCDQKDLLMKSKLLFLSG